MSSTHRSSTHLLRYEMAEHIVTLTIDRPDRRNAISGEVARSLEAALDRFEGDDDAWVAILTGTGPVFCAGADLTEVASGEGAGISTARGGFAGFVARPRTKPVIAALNGPAVAGGFELALACDMVVMADGAHLSLPEVERSLVATGGGLFRLQRTIGPARAAEVILAGGRIEAAEALSSGLVNIVVDADEVAGAARALAARVTANAPLAVQASLAVMGSVHPDESELFASSEGALGSLVQTADFAEGPAAFLAKRAPTWLAR